MWHHGEKEQETAGPVWPEISIWLGAILGGALWCFIAVESRKVLPLRPTLEPVVAGDFPRDGQFPTTTPRAEAPFARAWGSWAGTDAKRGILTLGPFPAPARLKLGIAGYPGHEGNGIYLELISTGERWRVPATDAGEHWQLEEFDPPAPWRRRPVRLIAVDATADHGGWLAITEPLRGGWSPGGEPRRPAVLNLWASQALLLAILVLAVARGLVRRVPKLRGQGIAVALGLAFLAFAPWCVDQNSEEPNFTTMLVAVAGTAGLFVLLTGTAIVTPLPILERVREISRDLRDWWEIPGLNPWVLGALALLLFLRKPHALHTPQLWAEDGSIFLAFNDFQGLRALVEPYMGYLHTIPRLIALSASKLLDPAWWPAFYNGVAFAIWLAVIARTFSRRFILPGKPWLALAFILGPHTGEVLFNTTNVQWITAFIFIQQVLLIRPSGPAERAVDVVLLLLAGLTGPFAIVFAPLLAWRWWRERNSDTLAALVVVAACAALQGWFILRTAEKFPYQAEPFHLGPAIEVIARRVVVWPLFGPDAALAIPGVIVGGAGLMLLILLFVQTWRPHIHRELRLRVAMAFVLILAIGIYRTRPDTWAADNLYFSDRYFYIPRVLLAWLLILQFDAKPRPVARTARLVCLAIAVIHLKDYVLPAPIDYHWRQHCDPIRRGEPADIATLPEGWILEYRSRSKG